MFSTVKTVKTPRTSIFKGFNFSGKKNQLDSVSKDNYNTNKKNNSSSNNKIFEQATTLESNEIMTKPFNINNTEQEQEMIIEELELNISKIKDKQSNLISSTDCLNDNFSYMYEHNKKLINQKKEAEKFLVNINKGIFKNFEEKYKEIFNESFSKEENNKED